MSDGTLIIRYPRGAKNEVQTTPYVTKVRIVHGSLEFTQVVNGISMTAGLQLLNLDWVEIELMGNDDDRN